MKWKGKFEFKGNRRVFKKGIREYLIESVAIIFVIALIIGLFFLNSYRWGCS